MVFNARINCNCSIKIFIISCYDRIEAETSNLCGPKTGDNFHIKISQSEFTLIFFVILYQRISQKGILTTRSSLNLRGIQDFYLWLVRLNLNCPIRILCWRLHFSIYRRESWLDSLNSNEQITDKNIGYHEDSMRSERLRYLSGKFADIFYTQILTVLQTEKNSLKRIVSPG